MAGGPIPLAISLLIPNQKVVVKSFFQIIQNNYMPFATIWMSTSSGRLGTLLQAISRI